MIFFGLHRHPNRQQPKEHQWCVGHDEDACDDEGIDGGGEKQRGIKSRPRVLDVFADAVDDIGVGGHEDDRGQSDEELAVEQQVEAEQLDDPAHHGRMVEMAPIGIEGVGPVVDLVVAELHPGRQNASHEGADDQKPN